MEQTASTALITAIIAVVLGGLGLIGGVIGYVQGTAALRRATLTRQRATAAEEAATQARTQAEQAARTAQSVLDRLTGLRSAADVADLPTGPLVLPPRLPAPGADSRVVAAAQPQLPPTDSAYFTPAPAPEPSPFARPEEEPARPGTEPSYVPLVTGPVRVQPGSGAPTSDLAENPTPPSAEPFAGLRPAAPATGPSPVVPAPEASAGPDTGPTAVLQEPEDPTSGPAAASTAPVVDPVPTSTGPIPSASEAPAAVEDVPSVPTTGPTPTVAAAEAPSDEPAPIPSPAAAPSDALPSGGSDPAPAAQVEQIDGLSDEPPVSQRSSTGQITAGTRGTAPMDWAEALRTGAIPLPARSRGTYSAPSKAKGQPLGPARFEIRAVGRQRYEAVNVGGATAEQASLEGAGDDSHLVRPVEARPKPVVPGDSLAFSVLRVEGRDVSVRIAWMLNGDEEQAELPVP